jgi:hypothetical protein
MVLSRALEQKIKGEGVNNNSKLNQGNGDTTDTLTKKAKVISHL